jgi:hypothetical protein
VSGHTPGPWVVEAYENVTAAKADNAFEWASDHPDSALGDCFNGGPVASVWQLSEHGDTSGLPGCIEVSLANARLIAAAPDLLACLKEAVAANEDGLPRDADDPIHDWKAAIAKAEGR